MSGLLASVLSGMIFLALYAWRLAKESRQMADALAATEMVLAREQQLHALDGLAAAAAHELGTPLSTITVVAKELARDAPPGSQFADDLALLQTQAVRCREILKKLTRAPSEPDPLHARMSVTQLIEEAAGPYRGFNAELVVDGSPEAGSDGAACPGADRRAPARRHLRSRQPGRERRRLRPRAASRSPPRWSAREVAITIADDGPGVPADVMDALGEPYVTTRPARPRGQTTDGEPSGLGLGLLHRQDPAGALGRHRQPRQPRAPAARRHRQGQLAARGLRAQAGGLPAAVQSSRQAARGLPAWTAAFD